MLGEVYWIDCDSTQIRTTDDVGYAYDYEIIDLAKTNLFR